jgi:hypothetical protein
MEENKATPQSNSLIKPVEEYLVNGPIPAYSLAYLDFVENYLENGIADSQLDIQFMLESISIHGMPKWWKGSIAQFEREFHDQYQRRINDIKKHPEMVWRAAEAEVQAKRLLLLPDNETDEQLKIFLEQGKQHLQQAFAVELLLDMWVEEHEKDED